MRTPAAPAVAPSPSALRIGALSTAVSLNLLALVGLSLMQASMPTALRKPPADTPIQFDIVQRTPQAPTPVPPMPVTPVRPTPREIVPPVPVVAPVPVAESAWTTEAVAVEATPAIVDTGAPVDLAPSGGGAYNALTYLNAPPPKYPPLARRRGWQGEVVLRVHVGLDGRPLSVEVETGSGHALLDRTAREHVLATWRFAPAQVDGRSVEAWGRVPIVFALQ